MNLATDAMAALGERFGRCSVVQYHKKDFVVKNGTPSVGGSLCPSPFIRGSGNAVAQWWTESLRLLPGSGLLG